MATHFVPFFFYFGGYVSLLCIFAIDMFREGAGGGCVIVGIVCVFLSLLCISTILLQMRVAKLFRGGVGRSPLKSDVFRLCTIEATLSCHPLSFQLAS